MKRFYSGSSRKLLNLCSLPLALEWECGEGVYNSWWVAFGHFGWWIGSKVDIWESLGSNYWVGGWEVD